jgi:hypothetical protein
VRPHAAPEPAVEKRRVALDEPRADGERQAVQVLHPSHVLVPLRPRLHVEQRDEDRLAVPHQPRDELVLPIGIDGVPADALANVREGGVVSAAPSRSR